MDQHSHTYWSHPPSHGCLQQGLKTFTGSGTRGDWHGRGDSHTKPFIRASLPRGPTRPLSPASAPCHELARPWGADGAVTRKCSAAAQEYPGSEAGMGCLSHTWMGSDWQTQHNRTTPGTPPVCTASKVLPASWASPCTHTKSSKPEFSIHPSIPTSFRNLRSQSMGNLFQMGGKGRALVVPSQDRKTGVPNTPSFPRSTTALPAATTPTAAEHPSRRKLERTAAAFQS